MTGFPYAVHIDFSKMSLLSNLGWNSAENPSELNQLDFVLHDLLVPSPEHGVVQKAAIPSTKPTAIFPEFIQMPSKEHEEWFHLGWSNPNMEVPQDDSIFLNPQARWMVSIC